MAVADLFDGECAEAEAAGLGRAAARDAHAERVQGFEQMEVTRFK